MVCVRDVMAKIEQLAPTNLAESWDNVGLLVGNDSKQVKRIMVMLDADVDTIDEAIANNVDLIVTHHPVLIKPINKITDDKLIKLIKNDISLYSAHTNLDSANGGVNDVLAQKLGLDNISNFTLVENSELLGRIGEISECTLGEFIKTVKTALNCEFIKYVGDKSKIIRKVGVCGGGGADFIAMANNSGCDVYVTGDVKYHQAQLANEMGLCVIDAGHFETENIICSVLADYLQDMFKEIEVLTSNRKESYLKYE
jgi:dinuclear metal center YbgI/SA1388 family protein